MRRCCKSEELHHSDSNPASQHGRELLLESNDQEQRCVDWPLAVRRQGKSGNNNAARSFPKNENCRCLIHCSFPHRQFSVVASSFFLSTTPPHAKPHLHSFGPSSSSSSSSSSSFLLFSSPPLVSSIPFFTLPPSSVHCHFGSTTLLFSYTFFKESETRTVPCSRPRLQNEHTHLLFQLFRKRTP
jgi:hypothetical protein